jgi:hypothetical protein
MTNEPHEIPSLQYQHVVACVATCERERERESARENNTCTESGYSCVESGSVVGDSYDVVQHIRMIRKDIPECKSCLCCSNE